MSILLDSEAFVVPRGDGKSTPLVIDMREIYHATGRLCEISYMTQAKSGELAQTFIKAWGTASEELAKVTLEWTIAKQNLRSIKAMVVLDRSSDVLKAKGLLKAGAPAGSEDLRNSVVEQDTEHKAASTLLAQLEACSKFLEIKAEQLKMAYFTVNKLMGNHDRDKDTHGGAGSDDVGAYSDTEKAQQFAEQHATKTEPYKKGFGTAKY